MMKPYCARLYFALFLYLFPVSVHANELRISSIVVDLSKSTVVRLSPGLACQIKFQDEVGDVTAGSPDDVLVLRSPSEPKRITIMLKTAQSRATNLFVISGGKTFIFDLVPPSPGHALHQDYIEIVGSHSGPRFQGTSNSKAETRQGGV